MFSYQDRVYLSISMESTKCIFQPLCIQCLEISCTLLTVIKIAKSIHYYFKTLFAYSHQYYLHFAIGISGGGFQLQLLNTFLMATHIRDETKLLTATKEQLRKCFDHSFLSRKDKTWKNKDLSVN